MKRLILPLFLFILLTESNMFDICSDITLFDQPHRRVYNGRKVQSASEVPWNAALSSANGYIFCSGSIVAKNLVSLVGYFIYGTLEILIFL